jgi:DNA-binding CsgD family transcriptional regulator
VVSHSERGVAATEDGVRAVLEALRTVVDPDDTDIPLSRADARAILSDVWVSLSDVLAERVDSGAVELLEMLRKLDRIDDGLLRARETTRQIGDVLARLEALPCSVAAVVGAAPRLIGDLGFDRAIVSGIFEGVWISQAVFIADDPQWAETINRIGQEQPQTLTPSLFESEVVRRREAVVVTDVQRESRVHRPIAEASLSRSYVAAPIISRGRVIGLLHADRYFQGRDTDLIDRETLASFAHGLRLALSRAAVAEQLQSVSNSLNAAAADTEEALSGLHDFSLVPASGPAADEPAPIGTAPRVLNRALHSARDVLTRREVEVVELMAQGRTNAAIASQLVISEGTVKQHVKHILRKLRAENRAEAVSRLYQSDRG